MSNEKRTKRINVKWKIPKLKLWQRILLYVLMIVFAVLSLVNVATERFSFVLGIVFYVLAALTLFPGIFYLIFDIRDGFRELDNVIKPKLETNRYTSKLITDYRFRTVLLSVPGLTTSLLYAIFNGITGIWSRSPWFGSLSAYYILLSMMRIGAVKQERTILKIEDAKERLKKENVIYRRNSMLFILLAIVLAGMVVLLVHSQGGKQYPGLLIYVAATYTFYRVIMSFVHMIKDRKQDSPLITIILKIGYVDSCVSILTLQTALFAAFANGQEEFVNLMNLLTGTGVCLIVFAAGIQGIVVSGRRNKAWKMEEQK